MSRINIVIIVLLALVLGVIVFLNLMASPAHQPKNRIEIVPIAPTSSQESVNVENVSLIPYEKVTGVLLSVPETFLQTQGEDSDKYAVFDSKNIVKETVRDGLGGTEVDKIISGAQLHVSKDSDKFGLKETSIDDAKKYVETEILLSRRLINVTEAKKTTLAGRPALFTVTSSNTAESEVYSVKAMLDDGSILRIWIDVKRQDSYAKYIDLFESVLDSVELK